MSALKNKHYNTILAPVITEKATLLSEQNKVVFRVPLQATKKDIKEAVEALFKVKVGAVNTIVRKGKVKNFRSTPSKRSDHKNAVVTLLDGYSIDVTTGL